MSARKTFATMRRVLTQLRHDPRTIAMMLVVPSVLMGLLAWMLPDHDLNKYGPPLLGIFPLLVMFLVTSVATLRERTSGTLERLLTMPIAKADFVFGYAFAFGSLAVLQALVVSGLSFGVYGMEVRGEPWLVVLVAVVNALLGTALGLSVSAFAATEFQAVQFLPAVLLPQLLLCGVIVPRDALPTVLEWISNVLPLSYAIDAVKEVIVSADVTSAYRQSVLIVVGFVVVLLTLGAATLRRRTP
jgi:ABC-2 type transport system permease protein